VESGDETLAVTGDLLVHAIQLVAPRTGYALEADQGSAARERVRMYDRLAEVGGVLATAHLSDPWIDAVRLGGSARS
jgi:hypothetical protein